MHISIIFYYCKNDRSLTHDTHGNFCKSHCSKKKKKSEAVLCTTQIPFSSCCVLYTMCLRALINFQFQVAQFCYFFSTESSAPYACSCTNLLNNVSEADAISFTWSIQIHIWAKFMWLVTFVHAHYNHHHRWLMCDHLQRILFTHKCIYAGSMILLWGTFRNHIYNWHKTY